MFALLNVFVVRTDCGEAVLISMRSSVDLVVVGLKTLRDTSCDKASSTSSMVGYILYVR